MNGLFYFFVALPASVITNGVGAMLLWRWFVAPLGVPVVGFWHALGLALFVSFVTFRVHDEDTDNRSFHERMVRLATTLAMKWVAVGIGFLIWSATP